VNTAIFGVAPAVLSTIFLSLVLLCRPAQADRRMAIEMDINAVCFAIADVSQDGDKVHRHLDYGCMALGIDDDLAVADRHRFSQVLLRRTRDLFQKLRTRQEHFRASRVRAVARQSLQVAYNGDQLIQVIRRTTGIDIHFLSPEEEERMDFYSALAASKYCETPVVLDIGKARYQMILADGKSGPLIHKGELGSAGFMAYLKEVVQDKPAKSSDTLLPISIREMNAGMDFARYLARRTPPAIQDALKKEAVPMTGTGAFFQKSFASGSTDRLLSREGLRQYIYTQLVDDRANDLSVANAILVLGFMEELDIEKLRVSDHNSTVGMLQSPILWH